MALTSPDRIEMDPSQQQRLRHLIRAGTTAQQLVLRARIVLLAVAGWTNPKIAARVGVCVDTVRKWRHRWWVQPGTASLGDAKRSGRPPSFTPVQVAAVKALACQPPEASGLPLSRWSCTDLAAQVVVDGIAASVSTSTVRRWLAEDAIKPWQYQSWIFVTDPNFAAKAARVLDVYNRVWDGKPLSANDYVVSADEKTSIQARCRCHPYLPPGKARMMRVSHDYHRGGALAYLAAYDVHRAKIYGRCEATTGIEPFTALVAQVMTQEPYASADRVFWVVDNGSSHRDRRPSTGSPNNSPTRFWCTPRSTRPGSTRSRSTSRSSSEKRCPPTTSPTSTSLSSASPASRSATTRPPNPSSGSSPPTISPISWNDSTDTKKPRPQTAPNQRQPDPRRTYKPDH